MIDLIARYAEDLKTKCGMTPDMALLTKVTIGCGPSIYDADASTVAASQTGRAGDGQEQFPRQEAGPAGRSAVDGRDPEGIDTYGQSERNKYRAVVYYMLTKHFGKEGVTAERSQHEICARHAEWRAFCASMAIDKRSR